MGADPPRTAIVYALPDERRHFGPDYAELIIVPGHTGATGSVTGASGGSSIANLAPYAARIGVGGLNAFHNTSLLLRAGPPIGALVIVGFAGGLDRALEPGDLVVAERIATDPQDSEYRPDPSLFALAGATASGVPLSCGVLLNLDHVVCRAADKRRLAETSGAIAVDMESAGAAAAAEKFGVPWIAVRAITDGVDDDLPFDFNMGSLQARSDPFGGVDRGAIIAGTLRQPWKIPALIRLGVRSSLAARNLGTFLQAFLADMDGASSP